MPVVRVPVVHRFGIVSVSRAEQLLREGRRDKRDKSSAQPVVKTTSPTKISQSFIEKYNKASDAERGKLDRTVQRTLLQAKYKAGLHKSHGSGVRGGADSKEREEEEREGRVCDAWLELILLCQCYGPHQEDVLLALALSLNHAPLSNIHIPSLLYMCGLCYQWLKSDVSVSHTTGQLRTGELLLLRILYLISLRLYYHQMVGTLKDICTREDIRQLKFDLQGFESRERAYRNFPEALLHWKVALEVGQIVVERNSPVVLHDPSDPTILSPLHSSPSKPSSSHNTSEGGEQEGRGGGRREVLPLLKHSLAVWQAVRGQRQLEQAISNMAACNTEFSIDNWMESLLAINILCLGSQQSLPVLTLLLSLTTSPPTPHHPPPSSSPRHHLHSDTPHLPLSTPHSSASLLQDTPTTRISQDTSPGRLPYQQDSTPAKKGTRFMLPEAHGTNTGSLDGSLTPDSLVGKRRGQVDTLNVLGQQPGFREPSPESVFSEPPGGGLDNDCSSLLEGDAALLPSSPMSGRVRDLVSSQSEVAEPDSHSLESTEELDNRTTSPSQSLMMASSPWFKSSTSKNLEPSCDEEREGDAPLHKADPQATQKAKTLVEESKSDTAYGAPVRDKLNDLASTLGESLSSVLGDSTPEPLPGRSTMMLSEYPRNVETRCTHYTHSSSALSDGAGVPGSHVAPSTIYRQSVYSPLTLDVGIEEASDDAREEEGDRGGSVGGGGGEGVLTVAGSARAGFESWPSEVGLAYVLGMGEVVLYGRTSGIQSAGLEGGTEGGRERVLGLRQLAKFSLNNHGSPSKESECMAWMVRHCAVLGLSRVCRVNRQLTVKDGLGGMAWSLLMQGHSTEKDSRVLEAYKMSQVYPDVDGPLLAMETAPLSSPLLAHMADELARILLPPPVAGIFPFLSPKSPPKRPRQKVGKSESPQKTTAKVDTYHKRGVCRPSQGGYAARTLGALQNIVEQDWRREMQKEREQEEQELNKERSSALPLSATQDP